jgi:integrase
MPRRHYTPKLRRHKPSQQGVVTLNGRDYYLGSWPAETRKPPEDVRQAYDAKVAEWLAAGRSLPAVNDGAPTLTVNGLILAFYRHAEQHYRRPDGTHTSELADYRKSLRPLRELFGRLPVVDFSPLKLKAVRQKMLEADLCRRVINQRIRRIVRMYKWGVAEELVPETVYRALTAVTGLQYGRSPARESKPVKPVPEAFVSAVLPHVLPPVRAMIHLQRLTGMRPGEVCVMRACDLDTSGPVWLYRPGSDQGPDGQHKTAHHGKQRIIPLGPQAQAIVRPFLTLDTQAYLFSPRLALEQYRAELRSRRKTKVQPSQVNRRRRKPQKRPGERYTSCSYDRAIAKGCDKADRASRQQAIEEGMDAGEAAGREFVAHWHPNQLRHSHGTEVRRRFGLEAAQVALGHSQANVTQVYAERDLGLAIKVAAAIG